MITVKKLRLLTGTKSGFGLYKANFSLHDNYEGNYFLLGVNMDTFIFF